MKLRPYQNDAIRALYRHLRDHDDNPCIVIPTAGGKTPVLATIARDVVTRWHGRVAILAHVKELLEQAEEKIRATDPQLPIGVCSAKLKRRDYDYPITLASIQSIYKHANRLGPVDLIIVDEAHLLPPNGDGMYRTFLTAMRELCPHTRIIGLTATPYRTTTGLLCAPSAILNSICYEIGVRDLIDQGYLCQLVSRAGRKKVDTRDLTVSYGEYVAGETEKLMNTDDLVNAAVDEIVEMVDHDNRQSVLIFTSGVTHGAHVVRAFQERGLECGWITGDTSPLERSGTIARFKDRELRFLANVNVLTTGFDAPNVDCVVLLRPTLSPGLYYQMVGRGFRLYPDKANCLILDFAGNVVRHGPVDALRADGYRKSGDGKGGDAPMKECPKCHLLIAAATLTCPDCGHAWPPPEVKPKHLVHADGRGILSGQVTIEDATVKWWGWEVHCPRNPDKPPSMKVSYQLGWGEWVSEWVCFEHSGYAKHKAHEWWRQRSNAPVPADVNEAIRLANAGALCETHAITIKRVAGDDFDRIIKYELGPIPEWTDEMARDMARQQANDEALRASVAAAFSVVGCTSKPLPSSPAPAVGSNGNRNSNNSNNDGWGDGEEADNWAGLAAEVDIPF